MVVDKTHSEDQEDVTPGISIREGFPFQALTKRTLLLRDKSRQQDP